MNSKSIIKIIIAGIAVFSAIMIFAKSGSTSNGIELYDGQSVYLKCVKCSSVQELNKDDYFKTVHEKFNNEERPFACEKCGGDCYRALKCSKCSNVFIRGIVQNDYSDRCPKCGFSETQAGTN